MQAKLTSLYGNGTKESNQNFMKDKFPEDCVVVEKSYLSHNYRQNHCVPGISKAEEEEGAFGVSFKKRIHRESISPRIENVKSPSCGEEADIDAPKGFVTARAKLVCISFTELP